MNVLLLEKVKEAIAKDAAHFDMRYFAAKAVPGCGSVMCIAGHAIHIGKGLNIDQIIAHPLVFNLACDLLGITSEQGNSLFVVADWPDDLFLKFHDCDISQRAKLACERIDRFIQGQ